MRRVLAVLIAAVILFNFFSFAVSAENISFVNGSQSANTEDIGEISSFSYDPESKKININGTIAHDTMISHNEDKIEVYRIPNGKTVAEVISNPNEDPIITSLISVKFHFSINAETSLERFSAYVVVIMSESGDWVTVGKPRYATVATSMPDIFSDKSYYKGITTELTSNATDAAAGTAIIPIHFEKLLSNSSTGHLYSLQGTHIYFDKHYVKELDSKINSYAAIGSRVYLQFLFSPLGNSGVVGLPAYENQSSAVPDMRVSQNLTLICAFTEFLCDRYSSLSGIVLGRHTDLSYPGEEIISADDYTVNFAQYMITVANVSRLFINDIDIVLPLSDKNSYSLKLSDDAYSSAKLLDSISEFFDETYVGGFVYSTLIESSTAPYGISDDTLKTKEFSTKAYQDINADNAYLYSRHLENLKSMYKSAPQSFIFEWTPVADISGNALACAYSYSYFKLMADKNINSFVVSFENSEGAGDYTAFPEILRIMKYIDTSECFDITAPQLELLGKSNWYAVISNMYDGKFDVRRILSLKRLSTLPDGILGSYVYYDFMYYTDISVWSEGNFCDSVKIDHSKISGRSLKAHFTPNRRSPSEYSEFFCDYDYPENFVYTPYISVLFSIEEDEIKSDGIDDEDVTPSVSSLYEVSITMGSDKNMSELTVVCIAGEEHEILFDMSEFSDISMASYIKVSIRKLGDIEDGKGYSFCLSSIKGYSDVYSSGELSGLIADERLRIRDLYKDEVSIEKSQKNTLMILAGAIVMILVIGIGVFMCFRKDDDPQEDDKEE